MTLTLVSTARSVQSPRVTVPYQANNNMISANCLQTFCMWHTFQLQV